MAETVTYKEGVLVGYRWFDAHGLRPAYPFGFGRSYTTFAFDRLRVATAGDGLTVTADVTNTGARDGVAVPQLYVGLPSPGPGVVQPPRQLRGFSKVVLRPGQRERVSFTLDRRALSYWDTAAGGWHVAPGCYEVMVGSSSRDLPLRSRNCRE